ncbi:MAG: hypothetical protein K8S21_08755 [Gemmatimonadetes bacterium]|nr:hypothetical protein [Gemmatimonadota bacterium]
MLRPEPFTVRHNSRTRLGLLVAAGEDGVGASVTASLLAAEARADGARVLIVGPALRAQRIAAMFGIAMPSSADTPVRLGRDIHVCGSIPNLCDADVIISVPSARAQVLLDAVDELCAHTSPTSALILAQRGGASLAATFAVLKLIIGRRPQCSASVAACGEADVSALFDAAERWLGHSLSVAPAIPIDPTLPIALGAGIPLAEAVASTALTTAAAALWSALATSALPGALA